MSEQRHGTQDWVVPAVLVGLGLGLLFVVGLAVTVSAEQRAAAPPLIADLDRYTECLVDHGADVPRVVVGRDGGFSVVVPGSLVAGEVDTDAWHVAADECGDVAPDLSGALIGGLLEGSLDGMPRGLLEEIGSVAGFGGIDEMLIYGDDIAKPTPRPGEPGRGNSPGPSDALARQCKRLETAGDTIAGPRVQRLRRECERLAS
jgi:hypothetical protein